jgi:hypothetical protein
MTTGKPTDAMLLPIVSDLNNMVEAIEEEGDRAYFGSTNDADRLKEIAAALDDWRFNLPQSAAASPDADLVERVARAIEREFYACVDEGPPQGVGFERVARAAIKALTATAPPTDADTKGGDA